MGSPVIMLAISNSSFRSLTVDVIKPKLLIITLVTEFEGFYIWTSVKLLAGDSGIENVPAVIANGSGLSVTGDR